MAGEITRDIAIDDGDPRGPKIAIAIQVSAAEREFMEAMRLRSYELAVARGHINRWPS